MVCVFSQPFGSDACFPQGTHMHLSEKSPRWGVRITLYKQSDPLELQDMIAWGDLPQHFIRPSHFTDVAPKAQGREVIYPPPMD